jgi:hypothetical protein
MAVKNTLISYMFIPKTTRIRAFCVVGLLFSANSNATCPRGDVAYYLKEGFSHEQVVQLCSKQKVIPPQQMDSSTSKNTEKTVLLSNEQKRSVNTTPTIIQQREVSSINDSNQDAIFLATAVEAYDLDVTDKAIIFKRKDCFNYGQEDWNEFQDRACPNVKYIISRKDLKIVDRDNGFFGMGSTALYVSGNIEAEILDLGEFQPKHQEVIKATIQKNIEKLKINVRSGMPQNKVEAIFLKLAN